jgi:HSP20 family molecular chaperone IbpA
MPSNLNTFWSTPSSSIQANDHQMALFAPLSLSHINFPHYQWNWNAPQFIHHPAEDRPHHKPVNHHRSSHLFHLGQHTTPTPAFDLHETDTHYFLDGDFPGTSTKTDIDVHWTGKRTLVISATIPSTDIEREWGITLPKHSPSSTGTSSPEPQATTDNTAAANPSGAEADEDLSLHRCLTNEEPNPSNADNQSSTSTTNPTKPPIAPVRNDSATSQTPTTKSLENLKRRLSWPRRAPNTTTPSPSETPEPQNAAQPTTNASSKPRSKSGSRSKVPPSLKTWFAERHTGPLRRVFTFPEDVRPETLKARLSAGVLRVMVEKAEGFAPRSVSVDVVDAGFVTGYPIP